MGLGIISESQLPLKLNIYSRGDPVGGALVISGLVGLIPTIIIYHEFSDTIMTECCYDIYIGKHLSNHNYLYISSCIPSS